MSQLCCLSFIFAVFEPTEKVLIVVIIMKMDHRIYDETYRHQTADKIFVDRVLVFESFV